MEGWGYAPATGGMRPPTAMAAERIHVYEILEPVSRGGPGRVCRARVAEAGGPLPLDSIVALRTITESEAGGIAVLQELVKDHGTARRISSHAVASPADFGVSSGPQGKSFWSVARWADGRTLTAVLADAGMIPDPLVESLTNHAAQALLACHGAGICGMGLSPDTLLLRDDATAVLLDPGWGAAQPAAWPQSGPLTMPLGCAAPETIRSRDRATERSDLYCLGAMLFRAMTERWHRPDDAQALRCEPESFGARRPSDVHPRLSIFLDELVFALLHPDPKCRLASSQELVTVLDKRRDSAWWKSLHIAQETYIGDGAPRDRIAAEPSPPPIPAPAAPPDASWIAERRGHTIRLAAHPAPVVGRDEDVRALIDAAARLRERGGEVRLIESEAGVGKTRLVDAMLEFVGALPASDAPIVLAGEHRRLGIGRPLRAFTEAFTRLVAGERDVGAAQVAPLLGEAVAIAPAFAAFLSGSPPPENEPPLLREGITAAFGRSLARLASASPVVLVIENLQWADPEGLDLFGHLARLTAELPILIVGTFRPVPRTSPLAQLVKSLRSLDRIARTHLEPLSPADSVRLVRSMVVPSMSADAIALRIHDASEGVPLRVVETLRLLEAEKLVTREAGGKLAVSDLAAAADLPVTEGDIWARRLAAMPASERAMLCAAAVQGYAFDADVARRTLHMQPAEAEAVLASLARGALVEGEGPARRFVTNSLFDRVHDDFDDAALEALHEAAANAFLASRNPGGLPPSQTHGILSYRVAWHYLLAGRCAKGLAYVEPAMRHLRQTWRLGDAERLAELVIRALASEPDRGGELIDMLLARAEFLGHQNRRVEQRELLDEALLRSRDGKDLAREARVLLEAARQRCETEQCAAALAEGRDALAAARNAGDDATVARCQALLGSLAFREARYEEARSHVSEMLDLARRRADAVSEAEALQQLGTISQSVGAYDQAEELHRNAMNIYRRRGDIEHEADALASLGGIAAASGDLVKAEGLLRRALAIERAVGDGPGEARVLGRLGMVLQDAQRCAEARAAHAECLRVARRMGSRHNEVVALLNLATVEYVLARFDDARAFYGDAMRIARELRESRLMGYALTGLGEVSRQGGESEVSRGLLERAVLEFRHTDDRGGLAAALLACGRVEMLGGDQSRAERLLAEARDLALAQDARFVASLALALTALIRARRGQTEEAQAAMAESGAVVQDVRASDPMRVEVFFFHSLVQRVLGRKVEADRKMLQAEALLFETTLEMSRDDRERIFDTMSPHREILAGAGVARAAAKAREGELSGTAPV